jgi:hypothetical protein
MRFDNGLLLLFKQNFADADGREALDYELPADYLIAVETVKTVKNNS